MIELQNYILSIILATLAAIVYSLRVLVRMERRIMSMDENIGKLVGKVYKEELKIEKALKNKK